MAGTWIVRHTEHGRRLYPVDPAEAEKLEKLGKARRVKAGLYEAKVSAPVEDEVDLDDPSVSDTVYETKVMTPEQPPKRRRGRPRKPRTPDVSD